MWKMSCCLFSGVAVVTLLASPSLGSDAYSHVDVGRRHADASAGYHAPEGIARTQSRVGRVNVGRGLAVGFGAGGVSLSHSIGVVRGGAGAAHNFQLSVGPHGTHSGHSGVVTRGGQSRVVSGGETWTGPGGSGGSNFATGSGRRTEAWARSATRNRPSPPFRPPFRR